MKAEIFIRWEDGTCTMFDSEYTETHIRQQEGSKCDGLSMHCKNISSLKHASEHKDKISKNPKGGVF